MPNIKPKHLSFRSNTILTHPLSILIFLHDDFANHLEAYIQPFPWLYSMFLPPHLLTWTPLHSPFLIFSIFANHPSHPPLADDLFKTFSYFAIWLSKQPLSPLPPFWGCQSNTPRVRLRHKSQAYAYSCIPARPAEKSDCRRPLPRTPCRLGPLRQRRRDSTAHRWPGISAR